MDGEWTREAAARAVPGLGEHLRRREASVASLVLECAGEAAMQGVELVFLDVSGGVGGWVDGSSDGPLGVDVGWQLGIDVSLLSKDTRVLVVAYSADPDRVRDEVLAYRGRTEAKLDVLLRPMSPDCTDTGNLVAKLRHCADLGLDRVDFYHYGMMPTESLGLIKAAVEGP